MFFLVLHAKVQNMLRFLENLQADPPNVNSTTDSETQPLNDIGNTWSTLSNRSHRHKAEDD